MVPPHGRGAGYNPPNRFEARWYERDPDLEEPPGTAPATVFFEDATKSIIATNDSPDIGFDKSINVYRGCEHGCSYCFARPTHEYLGMSAGLDFESKIVVKYKAPQLLQQTLEDPRWVPERLQMSGVTDCYQPIERKLELTRQCLTVLAEYRNPVTILTKNHLVVRDLDVLSELARHDCVAVFVSVTSLDAGLIGTLEPRTSRPQARLAAIRALTAAGIPAGVMVGPVIPGLTEHELPAILTAAAEAGARYAGWTGLRLPLAVKPIFIHWLEEHFPERKDRVLNHVKAMRGGRLNAPQFHERFRMQDAHMGMVRAMFKTTCAKLGLNKEPLELSVAHFRRRSEQLRLF